MRHIEFEIMLSLAKNKEMHVRALATYLKMPHATISRALKFLLRENVLDYRKEGKNKVYSIKSNIEAANYVKIAEHYKLLKLFKHYPFLAVISQGLTERINASMIIIYGSYAKFAPDKNSDIDLFIETEKKELRKVADGIHSKLSVKIGKFDKENLLIKEIIKDHVILKGVDRFYEEYGIFD